MEGERKLVKAAKLVARGLPRTGLDARAEDLDDVVSILTMCGLEARSAAVAAGKSQAEIELIIFRSLWNRKRNIMRDRGRAERYRPVNLDVGELGFLAQPEADLVAQIDAQRLWAELRNHLSPDQWALVDLLLESGGNITRAWRLGGCIESRTHFHRKVTALHQMTVAYRRRAQIRGLARRVVCG